MLSPSVLWVDIDPVQWANLWKRLYAPDRRPQRLIGLLDHGRPLALLDGRFGQLPLDVWPNDATTLQQAAVSLRRESQVDQVILVERDVLVALWGEQQRTLDCQDSSYDDCLLYMRRSTQEMLVTQAICDPPTVEESRFPAVPYEGIRSLIREHIGDEGAFVVAIFDHDELWWSLSGCVQEGVITKLTSSQGLFPALFTMPSVGWHGINELLVDACKNTFGTVSIALGFQLSVLDLLLSSQNMVATIDQLASQGTAIATAFG